MFLQKYLYKVLACRSAIESRKELYLDALKRNRAFYRQVNDIINRIAYIHVTEGLPLILNPERIRLAAGMAVYHHAEAKRKSGDPYFVHPLGLVKLLARRLKCPDEDVYIAAFLHDLKEDTSVSLDDIESLFGNSVRYLVDGLTKLEKAAEERNVEKFVFYLKKDIRILLLKAVDRGHNLLTSRFTSKKSRRRNAQEALDLYYPLCVLAGYMKAGRQLADVAFKILKPERYKELEGLIRRTQKENKQLIESLEKRIREVFDRRESVKRKLRRAVPAGDLDRDASAFIRRKSIRFFARPSTPYALFEKFAERGVEAHRFSDVIMIQVIVDDEEECFYVHDLIHSLDLVSDRKVRPLNRYYRDYVHDPKLNLYQSIHTAVEVGGVIVRFQIRTKSMQETAEKGIISQSYRRSGFINPSLPWLDSAYLEELMRKDIELSDKIKLLKALRASRYASVRISDPNVCNIDELPLPLGVSPLEVAFMVNPSVGMRLISAEANDIPRDVLMPVPERISVMNLSVGEEIIYRDYLYLLNDAIAKRKLVEYLRSLDPLQQRNYAEVALTYWLDKYHLTLNDIKVFDEKLNEQGFRGLENALKEIGKGNVSAYQILKEIIEAHAMFANDKRKPAKIEFHLKNWKEENYISLIGPLRAICGVTEKITIQKSKGNSHVVVSVSVSMQSKLVSSQVENFVRFVKEKYSDSIEGVVIKTRKRIKDPFYGLEVLDAQNVYHDFVKADVVRSIASSEDSLYVLNITEESARDIVGERQLAWCTALEDIRNSKLVIFRLPRRSTYEIYRSLREKLRERGIKVVYIFSDGRYGDQARTEEFVHQFIGNKYIVGMDVNREMLEDVFD